MSLSIRVLLVISEIADDVPVLLEIKMPQQNYLVLLGLISLCTPSNLPINSYACIYFL